MEGVKGGGGRETERIEGNIKMKMERVSRTKVKKVVDTRSGEWRRQKVKRETEIENERPQDGAEWNTNRSWQELLVRPLSAASVCIPPNHRDTGRRQNQKHKQVDRTTCKGKTQTTESLHIYLHTHTHTDMCEPHTGTHTFLVWTVLLCAAELRETAVSRSTPPPPWSLPLPRRENTPTQRWLSLQTYLFVWVARGYFTSTHAFKIPHHLQDLVSIFTEAFEMVIIKINCDIVYFIIIINL